MSEMIFCSILSLSLYFVSAPVSPGFVRSLSPSFTSFSLDSTLEKEAPNTDVPPKKMRERSLQLSSVSLTPLTTNAAESLA